MESLIREKRKITLWMGLFSILILAASIVTAVFLGKKMVTPLREMTKKAIQISEGQKDLLFETSKKNYWEFNQLSQAFNFMLKNLKDAEEYARYRELLQNVDDAVYILDLDGNIVEANDAAYSQLGYSRDDFFKLNIARIIPQEDAKSIIDQLGQDDQAPNPKKITIETKHYTTKGQAIEFEIHSKCYPECCPGYQ
jgi:PAS domain S-box-containing protein